MTRFALLLTLTAPAMAVFTGCSEELPLIAPAPFETCSANADLFSASDAELDGDTLTVTASYSGCSEVVLVPCWDASFMESDPVQVRVELDGADPGMCDAFFSHDVTIDLTEIRDAYLDAYGGTSGEVIVNIGDDSVSYTF